MESTFYLRDVYTLPPCADLVRSDIDHLLMHVLGCDKVFLLSQPTHVLRDDQVATFLALCERRSDREPLAYLTSRRSFYQHSFHVTPDVLIPRPESEIIVDLASEIIQVEPSLPWHVIDVGTGSGCIIISLAHRLQKSSFSYTYSAIDISPEALAVARANAGAILENSTIDFHQGDLLAPFLSEDVEVIPQEAVCFVANLPYVDSDKREELLQSDHSAELVHEPAIALWSDEGGLAHYIRLLTQIAEYTRLHTPVNVSALLEISPEQEEFISEKIVAIFPGSTVRVAKDLSGLSRIVFFEFPTL